MYKSSRNSSKNQKNLKKTKILKIHNKENKQLVTQYTVKKSLVTKKNSYNQVLLITVNQRIRAE